MDNANATRKQQGLKMPPALNPEQVALVQPYREFVATGLISSLKVEFTGGTTSVTVTLGASVKTEGDQAREGLTPAMAKQLIVSAGLWSPKGSKGQQKDKKDELPKKTLVKKDFSGTKDSLAARVLSVAEALGPSTARGRIGSLRMMQRGLDNFEKWWARAPSPSKARILMDGKHYSELTKEEISKLGSLPCPFRGTETVPTPTEEEAEEAEPQKGSA